MIETFVECQLTQCDMSFGFSGDSFSEFFRLGSNLKPRNYGDDVHRNSHYYTSEHHGVIHQPEADRR